jgi:hypothetical protein
MSLSPSEKNKIQSTQLGSPNVKDKKHSIIVKTFGLTTP